jgi:Rieske Fe-S protein
LETRARKILRSSVKYFWLLGGLSVLYVLLDFAIDFRPSNVQSSYRFKLGELESDEVKFLRQDNLSILVMRRSAATRAALMRVEVPLQDPDSRYSHQPDDASNPLRSRHAEYFVSYAVGTDLGCPLKVLASGFQESCSNARYDFAGRALEGNKRFQNLSIPDYNFDSDFSSLTIYP